MDVNYVVYSDLMRSRRRGEIRLIVFSISNFNESRQGVLLLLLPTRREGRLTFHVIKGIQQFINFR